MRDFSCPKYSKTARGFGEYPTVVAEVSQREITQLQDASLRYSLLKSGRAKDYGFNRGAGAREKRGAQW